MKPRSLVFPSFGNLVSQTLVNLESAKTEISTIFDPSFVVLEEEDADFLPFDLLLFRLKKYVKLFQNFVLFFWK